jgi:hypothetical protein
MNATRTQSNFPIGSAAGNTGLSAPPLPFGTVEGKVKTEFKTAEGEQPSPYYCTVEWHLVRLRDAKGRKVPFAAILYPFAYRISKKSGRFHCSAVNLAAHFETSQWTVLRAMEALTIAGFLIPLSKEPFQPSIYQVLSHKDWASAHPESCSVKAAFPWSGEIGDKLGVRLFTASGGRIKYMPHMLAALRNTGLADDEIVKHFESFMAQEVERRQVGGWHGRWKSVRFRFLRHLRGEPLGKEI